MLYEPVILLLHSSRLVIYIYSSVCQPIVANSMFDFYVSDGVYYICTFSYYPEVL